MKTLRKFKSKIVMFLLAVIFPLSATGMVYLSYTNTAKADSASSTYYTGVIKSVSLTNGNFSSGVTTHSLGTSLNGWSALVSKNEATAGIINTQNSFQDNMNNVYYLSNNPLAKGSDKYIMMINSKTSSSGLEDSARQGYKSSTVNLSANSYYSFQVSFKSDTNYNTHDSYDEQRGTIDKENFAIERTVFNATNKDFDLENDVYIQFSYTTTNGTTLNNIYLKKSLTLNPDFKITEPVANAKRFYDDANVSGFVLDGATENDEKQIFYVENRFVQSNTDNGTTTYSIVPDGEGVDTYTCNLKYNPENNNYEVPLGTPYFLKGTEHTSLNDRTFGSIYLDGLKDENGKTVKADFEKVTSNEWVTFYFFVATGSEDQSVTLNLWLGTDKIASSGVVFYDDCRVYQYSENEFWKSYQKYYGKSYTQQNSSASSVLKFDCTKLVNMKQDETLSMGSEFNFNFENTQITQNLVNWTRSGLGKAQVFGANEAPLFKDVTGYDYVGSDLSCEVELDGDKVDLIKDNKKLLALWAEDNSVRVTSKNIDIDANEIYKITVNYKISEITNGNAYLFVKENDSVVRDVNGYNLSESAYTLTAEKASSALSSTNSNEFTNGYGVAEFYVKGGAHYNSSINLSLGLGNTSETAKGCIVFDNIQISKATTEEFTNATNTFELNTKTGTQEIANGNFRNIEIEKNATHPYKASSWTVTSGNGTQNGVINVDDAQWEKYKMLYANTTAPSAPENPYYFTTFSNPHNVDGTNTPNNIMMLANYAKSWQTLSSANFNLEKGETDTQKVYKLAFNYKVNSSSTTSKLTLRLIDSNGVKLFEGKVDFKDVWSTYEILIIAPDTTTEAHLEIDFGQDNTQKDKLVDGIVYLDNFTLDGDASIPEETSLDVLDMSNNYANLPTNNITESLEDSHNEIFTGTASNTNSGLNGGIVKIEGLQGSLATEETDKIAYFLTSNGEGSYTLQSKFPISLTAEQKMAIKFKLKTNFSADPTDEDYKAEYGITFGLTGYKYMTNLKSSERYQEFTFYLTPTETGTANLYISLVCDAGKTLGSAAIYDLEFITPTDEEYADAEDVVGSADYDINENRVFISSQEDAEPDENPDDTNPDDNTTQNNNDFNWLLIPSLITAVAIVIAVVGYFLRKVKIKKIEFKKRESYDRKTSLNVDAIKKRAAEEQKVQAQEVQNTIDKFQKELDNLENAHKQKIVSMREQDKDKVSKQTDKEFKTFAQKRTVIAEKIESLNKKLQDINSPEYLLNLERKIYAEDEMKQRSLKKQSKKQEKALEEKGNQKEETKNAPKRKKK